MFKGLKTPISLEDKMQKIIRNIKVCSLLNGYELSLILHEISCNKPGPTLGLSATIHGDEDLPIEILRRLSIELEDIDFKGKIKILPVANPSALGAFTRNNPIDMANLNRVFPGNKEGTISEKIAYAIVTEYIPHTDYFIDLHSGGSFPTVEYAVIYPKGEELGKMLGLKYLYKGNPTLGSMAYYLENENKPVVIGEYGGGGQNIDYYISQGLNGIKNVMKYLRMIKGKPELPKEQYEFKEIFAINSGHGGIFKPNLCSKSMHAVIPKGDLLGTTYSPYTFEEIETFYGPYNRNLIILLRSEISKVESGELMFLIGNMDTVKRV